MLAIRFERTDGTVTLLSSKIAVLPFTWMTGVVNVTFERPVLFALSSPKILPSRRPSEKLTDLRCFWPGFLAVTGVALPLFKAERGG